MSEFSKKLLKPIELAELYHVSHRAVEGWRKRGVGPIPLHIPGVRGYRYDFDEAMACLEQYRHKPIGQVKYER